MSYEDDLPDDEPMTLEDLPDYERRCARIAQEIRMWSQNILERPSDSFGGLPPCPYASSAWQSGSVIVQIVNDLDDITDIKVIHPPTGPDIVIFAVLNPENFTPEDLQSYIDHQNKSHMGAWLMGFHPDSDPDPSIPEFEPLAEDDYALVLMQNLRHLVQSSDALAKTAYYSSYTPDDLAHLAHRKEAAHAWQEKIHDQGEEHLRWQADASVERWLQGQNLDA
mgnify:CR=1 FL=1